jgi:hypothetical protein
MTACLNLASLKYFLSWLMRCVCVLFGFSMSWLLGGRAVRGVRFRGCVLTLRERLLGLGLFS